RPVLLPETDSLHRRSTSGLERNGSPGVHQFGLASQPRAGLRYDLTKWQEEFATSTIEKMPEVSQGVPRKGLRIHHLLFAISSPTRTAPGAGSTTTPHADSIHHRLAISTNVGPDDLALLHRQVDAVRAPIVGSGKMDAVDAQDAHRVARRGDPALGVAEFHPD